jgi:hypothetical protein
LAWKILHKQASRSAALMPTGEGFQGLGDGSL